MTKEILNMYNGNISKVYFRHKQDDTVVDLSDLQDVVMDFYEKNKDSIYAKVGALAQSFLSSMSPHVTNAFIVGYITRLVVDNSQIILHVESRVPSEDEIKKMGVDAIDSQIDTLKSIRDIFTKEVDNAKE